MPRDKILSMLGLAARAGRTASGGFAAEQAVKSGKAVLLIIAEDASDNTRKRFTDLCRYYRVPCFRYAGKEALGHAIGRGERTTAAVTDEHLGAALEKLLKEQSTQPVEEGIYGE